MAQKNPKNPQASRRKRERWKKGKRRPKEKWKMTGRFCSGRHWKELESEGLEIKFEAFSPAHARKIGLERLKAYAKKLADRSGQGKFSLRGVKVEGGAAVLHLKAPFHNNSLLFVRRPHSAFESVCAIGA